MLNPDSLKQVQKQYFNPGFCKPIYEGYGFASIPGTVLKLLTGYADRSLPEMAYIAGSYDQVVSICLDGFSWNLWEKLCNKSATLRLIDEKGIVSQLTAQFPSTTTAHMTCLHTDLAVGESGFWEWLSYEPLVDATVSWILYSYGGDKRRETLRSSNITPKLLYPHETIYEKLKKAGVDSYGFQHAEFSHSPFSTAMFRGAEMYGWQTLEEALEKLRSYLAMSPASKRYFCLYVADIDTVSHDYGPCHEAVEKEALALFERLYQFVAQLPPKTALMIFADHGQTKIDLSKTIYLNQILPEITSYIRTNKKGEPLVPAGSSRDFFLYIQEEKLEEAKALVQKALEGKAWVLTTKELAEQGFFGSVLTPYFWERVGNLAILPYQGQAIWWYEKGRYEVNYLGLHGGLTIEEMRIPLLFLAT